MSYTFQNACHCVKRLLFLIIALIPLTMASQNNFLKFDMCSQDGSPANFKKQHPEYIYMNEPDPEVVTGFDYLISTVINPSSVGLNSNNFFIIMESLDQNKSPKALIWDGTLKQKIVKRMTGTKRRVVFFFNLFKIEDKLGYDEMAQTHHKMKYGLSSNGIAYARGLSATRSFNATHSSFPSPSVTVEWTENPVRWQQQKKTADQSGHAFFFQDASTLDGTKGWFFDVLFKVEGSSSAGSHDRYTKFGLTHHMELQLFKDKKCTQPLNVRKVTGGEQTYCKGKTLNSTATGNVIQLNSKYDPQMHQYYFLDQAALSGAKERETLSNGKIRLTAYYKVDAHLSRDFTVNAINGPLFINSPKDGILTLELTPEEAKEYRVEKGDSIIIVEPTPAKPDTILYGDSVPPPPPPKPTRIVGSTFDILEFVDEVVQLNDFDKIRGKVVDQGFQLNEDKKTRFEGARPANTDEALVCTRPDKKSPAITYITASIRNRSNAEVEKKLLHLGYQNIGSRQKEFLPGSPADEILYRHQSCKRFVKFTIVHGSTYTFRLAYFYPEDKDPDSDF